jgi:hypothetical protein
MTVQQLVPTVRVEGTCGLYAGYDQFMQQLVPTALAVRVEGFDLLGAFGLLG